MAAQLNYSTARVTGPDGAVAEKVAVIVRANRATVKRAGTTVIDRPDVTAVRATSRTSRTIEFANGDSMLVERLARPPCGCR